MADVSMVALVPGGDVDGLHLILGIVAGYALGALTVALWVLRRAMKRTGELMDLLDELSREQSLAQARREELERGEG